MFVKIPNYLFYDDGKVLESIGGHIGFQIYSYLSIMKNMQGYVTTTANIINKELALDSNNSRAREIMMNVFKSLEREGLIDVRVELESIKNNDIIKIKWLSTDKSGWTKLFPKDFHLIYKLDSIEYSVFWLIRAYKNYETQSSFMSIRAMSKIIACRPQKVQSSIELLEKMGVISIEYGSTYYCNVDMMTKRHNNEYRYNFEYNINKEL